MSARVRIASLFLVIAAAFFAVLYFHFGAPKPLANWKWMDIIGEGGTAIMSALWALLILSSRPGGRVTTLLVGGLITITLGTWADCLDEFVKLSSEYIWDNWLETLTPVGMMILTLGLYFWRQEQFSLNEHMQKRERLFREHRSFERLTQLADAGYLRRQIRLELNKHPTHEAALTLLDIDHFHRINREHGQREGDRLLQAVAHLLLLNLRPQDLICRYAGDRFAILMPDTTAEQAGVLAAHLQRAVSTLAHHTRDGATRIQISVRFAYANVDADPERLLTTLNAQLEVTSCAPQVVAA